MLGLGGGLEYQSASGDGERVVIYYHDFDTRGQRRTSPTNPTFIDMGSGTGFTLNNHTTYGSGMADWTTADALEDGGDKIGDMANDAGNAVEDACEDVKEGVEAEDDDC